MLTNENATPNILSIIIPTMNEAEGIGKTLQDIPIEKINNIGYEVQIIIVDTNSTDKTTEIASKLGAEIVSEPHRGYGRAYKTGFSQAKGEIIATADADGTYPTAEIPHLLEILISENLDFLNASRFPLSDKGAMFLKNRIGNLLLTWTARLLFGIKTQDIESGMWVFRKAILDSIQIKSDSHQFSHEIKIEAYRYNRFHWGEVTIPYKPRLGEVKLPTGWKGGFVNLFDIIRKRFVR